MRRNVGHHVRVEVRARRVARSDRAPPRREMAFEYGRSKVMASKASATAKMRAPSGMSAPARPERIAGAVPALVVVVARWASRRAGTGCARRAAGRSPDGVRMISHSSGVSGPGLRRMRVGDADLADVVEEHAVLERRRSSAVGHAVRAGDGQRVAVRPGASGPRCRRRGCRGPSPAPRAWSGRSPRSSPRAAAEVARGLGHPALQEDLVLAALDEELRGARAPARRRCRTSSRLTGFRMKS